ncbi:hypothetical protein Tco_1096360 [Tanacetum coccineum]
MSFSKRPDSNAVCYTKPLDSLKHRNDHFFWVDSFDCPASFRWHTGKNVSKDPFPKSTEFNANHYATLVAHPAPFWKYLEPFLYMDLLAFIRTADPTKVKVGERQRAEDEPKLLDSTGDFAVGGDDAAETGVVRIIDDETVAAEKPKRPRKKGQVVADASGSFHPPKKLREDHGTSSEAAIGVSATPEHEGDVPDDSITEANLCTIGPAESSLSFQILLIILVQMPLKLKLILLSADGTDPIMGDFSDLTGSDFLVGAICTVIDPDTDL